MRHVFIAAPFIAAACVLLLCCRRGYTALTLGEDTAASLGIDLGRLQGLTVLGVAIGVGAGSPFQVPSALSILSHPIWCATPCGVIPAEY
jgi:ABC-type Fe3+-siderophore transport system permease subunit